jgi:predicted nucleotidyltransferase
LAKNRTKNMMTTYNITYKQLQQLPYISEMHTALEKGLTKYNIDFYLVGKSNVANNIWTTAINYIPSDRVTPHIEFTFFINDKNRYADLREYLIYAEGFTSYKSNGFSLMWKNTIQVDLIPFAEIEAKPSKVTVGLTSLKLDFKEIYDSVHGCLEAKLEEKKGFKFCTLPGIVLQKLIVFQEYPKVRRDVIKDISKILEHFFDIYAQQIYEKHNDLFDNHDINLQSIAGRVIGRDMRKITELNEDLFFKIKNLLKKNTVDIHSSDIAKIMSEFFKNTTEQNLEILEQMKIGYLENPFIMD